MSEVDPEMFDDINLTTKGERREKLRLGKRKKPGPTVSDKQQRAAEIRAVREARVKEASDKIQSQLLERHFSNETREETERLQKYLKWVEDSLTQGYPFLEDKDIEIKGIIASVKAGGQHRQRKRTAVRATHLPSSFSVKNEEERSFEQNKALAREVLYRNLNEHLKLWQTMVKNSAAPVDVGQTILNMLKDPEGR